MPRQAKQTLASVPTEELVEELRKRFAAVEKAKAELLNLNIGTGTSTGMPVHKKHTSEYAKQHQSLKKRIYHAERRIESGNANHDDKANIQRWEADLKKLEANHQKELEAKRRK